MPDTLPRPEKRKPLTRVQFATLLLEQSGRCGCGCGKRLQPDRIIDEHLNPLDSLGSNDLSNRSLWDQDCSRAKTAADVKASAKGRRLRNECGQAKRRAERGGSIKSRGFDRTLRKRMDGTVVRVGK